MSLPRLNKMVSCKYFGFTPSSTLPFIILEVGKISMNRVLWLIKSIYAFREISAIVLKFEPLLGGRVLFKNRVRIKQ